MKPQANQSASEVRASRDDTALKTPGWFMHSQGSSLPAELCAKRAATEDSYEEKAAKKQRWTDYQYVEPQDFIWSDCWHRMPFDVIYQILYFVDEDFGHPKHVACAVTPCLTAKKIKAQAEHGTAFEPATTAGIDELEELVYHLQCIPQLKSLTVNVVPVHATCPNLKGLSKLNSFLRKVRVNRINLVDAPSCHGFDYSELPKEAVDRIYSIIWLEYRCPEDPISLSLAKTFPNVQVLTLVDMSKDDVAIAHSARSFSFPSLQRLVILVTGRASGLKAEQISGEWWLTFMDELKQDVEIELQIEDDALTRTDVEGEELFAELEKTCRYLKAKGFTARLSTVKHSTKYDRLTGKVLDLGPLDFSRDWYMADHMIGCMCSPCLGMNPEEPM